MQYARKQYMDQLIRKKDNGRIKVVTGLRRSGKSYLLFRAFSYLKETYLPDAIITYGSFADGSDENAESSRAGYINT